MMKESNFLKEFRIETTLSRFSKISKPNLAI